jgi:hypothetical protein
MRLQKQFLSSILQVKVKQTTSNSLNNLRCLAAHAYPLLSKQERAVEIYRQDLPFYSLL